MNPTVSSTLARHLSDTRSAWGVGVMGATAEFIHDGSPTERDLDGTPLRLVSGSGAVVIDGQDPQPIPYAVPGRRTGSLRRGMLFCLDQSAAALPCHTTLTELGPDQHSARPGDAADTLFDLGLGIAHLQACVRVCDARLRDRLRALCGEVALQPGSRVVPLLLEHNPHRVFRTRLARIEVYLPIPVHQTPAAPHTHVLPDRLRRTPPFETPVPLPEGMLSCLELYAPDSVSLAEGLGTNPHE